MQIQMQMQQNYLPGWLLCKPRAFSEEMWVKIRSFCNLFLDLPKKQIDWHICHSQIQTERQKKLGSITNLNKFKLWVTFLADQYISGSDNFCLTNTNSMGFACHLVIVSYCHHQHHCHCVKLYPILTLSFSYCTIACPGCSAPWPHRQARWLSLIG